LAWSIDFSPSATKQLAKIDKVWAKKIDDYLVNKVLKSSHPSVLAELLTANLSGKYRYRVGDYRIICELREEVLLVWVVELGHRKNVYG
jgi:mRNA interferase RelE/StbE